MNAVDSDNVWKTAIIDQKAKLETSWLRLLMVCNVFVSYKINAYIIVF